ncbi:MAG: bifunctional nicotinamidase/pyrazinamidase [Acidobacteriota bacterium]
MSHGKKRDNVRCLILVDLQNDFFSAGALPVPEAEEVLVPANCLQKAFDLVVATQDWHPPDHGSFALNHPHKKPGDVIQLEGLKQVLWPVHCVRGTAGAAFVETLDKERIQRVFQKGTDPRFDSYSGFFDNGRRKATGLGDYLRGRHVVEVYVLGLATDYCVKFTALDARQLGFEVCLILDACRGVNLRPTDAARAVQEMRAAGVHVRTSAEILGA